MCTKGPVPEPWVKFAAELIMPAGLLFCIPGLVHILQLSRSNIEFAISQPKWSDCHETKRKHFDLTQCLKCEHQVWPWPWPWPSVFKVTDSDQGDFKYLRAVDSSSLSSDVENYPSLWQVTSGVVLSRGIIITSLLVVRWLCCIQTIKWSYGVYAIAPIQHYLHKHTDHSPVGNIA